MATCDGITVRGQKCRKDATYHTRYGSFCCFHRPFEREIQDRVSDGVKVGAWQTLRTEYCRRQELFVAQIDAHVQRIGLCASDMNATQVAVQMLQQVRRNLMAYVTQSPKFGSPDPPTWCQWVTDPIVDQRWILISGTKREKLVAFLLFLYDLNPLSTPVTDHLKLVAKFMTTHGCSMMTLKVIMDTIPCINMGQTLPSGYLDQTITSMYHLKSIHDQLLNAGYLL